MSLRAMTGAVCLTEDSACPSINSGPGLLGAVYSRRQCNACLCSGTCLLKLHPSVAMRLWTELHASNREPCALANQKPLTWLDSNALFCRYKRAVRGLDEDFATDGRQDDASSNQHGVLLGWKWLVRLRLNRCSESG